MKILGNILRAAPVVPVLLMLLSCANNSSSSSSSSGMSDISGSTPAVSSSSTYKRIESGTGTVYRYTFDSDSSYTYEVRTGATSTSTTGTYTLSTDGSLVTFTPASGGASFVGGRHGNTLTIASLEYTKVS